MIVVERYFVEGISPTIEGQLLVICHPVVQLVSIDMPSFHNKFLNISTKRVEERMIFPVLILVTG